MEVKDIKTLDDIVLAYKKGQPLIYKDYTLRRILGFVEGTNEILLEHPCKDTPLCMNFETVKRNYKIVVSNKMEINTSRIIDIVHLQEARKRNKLIIDQTGNLYTIISIFDTPNGTTVQIQSVNTLERFAQVFCEFKENFKIVDYINVHDVDNFTSTNYINKNNKENKMEGYIERMIQEHKGLVPRINNLHRWVYGGAHEKVDATEFANECIQLKAYKVAEEALRARLFNAGVNYVDGQYLVSIDSIEHEKENPIDND